VKGFALAFLALAITIIMPSGSSARSWPGSSDSVESIRVLGRAAIAKRSFFAGPHYRAAGLRASLLAVARDTVCERRGHKAGYEKDQRNDHQQKEHQLRFAAYSTHYAVTDKSN